MDKDKIAVDVFYKMLKNDYYSQWMGLEAKEIKHNYCKLKMVVKRDMLNGFGILHGGIAYAYADSAFAFASNSEGRMAVSIQGSMNYHKSAVEGSILYAEAKCLNMNYKTGVFDVSIKDPEGQLYYSFRGTVYRKSESLLS